MNIYKSNQEIEERKEVIRLRELNRESVEQTRIKLLKSLKENRFVRFDKWFNRKFGWFFTNGMKNK